jgi:hypothetical protein
MVLLPAWKMCANVIKGPTLEEISRIFDGSDAVAHVDVGALEKDIAGDRLDNIGEGKGPRVGQTRV